MKTPLFSDFPDISSKQWKQKIQANLKGKDYNETLVWKTNESINVKPFYSANDLTKNLTPFKTPSNSWNINQTIVVKDISFSNLKAIQALQKGAESITFVLAKPEISLTTLLKGIDFAETPLYFRPDFLSEDFAVQLNKIEKKTSTTFYLQNDPIHHLAKNGNWYNGFQQDFKAIKALNNNCQHIKSVLGVNMSTYQNAGGGIVQQLAYGLAHANEYLNFLKDEKSIPHITFQVAVGSNYFFEIAKLKALRLLWKVLVSEYTSQAPPCHIIVSPTKRNKTVYDYNNNILRSTTECMSAILGGADSIVNRPYDKLYKNGNEFSERLARNQLLILKYESYLDKVNNPTDGAYYIESITEQLASKALSLFKEIEASGGFLHQLKKGTIQKKIKEQASKEQEQFNNNTISLIGINTFKTPHQKMKSELDVFPFVKTNKRKTLIEPLIERRLAEDIELKRLNNE